MSLKVYRFGARMPLDRDLVVAQLRAAHDYRNELIQYERGRREAMRALYDTPEIRDAEALLKQATKSDRKAAKRALYTLRREVLEARRDEAQAINALHHELQLGARALTRCYWGSYLDVESAMQQARAAPLYDEDGLTPSNPRFLRWREPMQGQIGMQLQASRPLTTADAMRGADTRVRVERRDGPYATLWIRVGSEGRAPVWARVPIKMHREIPNAATWKWVRVSCEPRSLRDNPEYRETWSVEITVDDPAPRARDLDTSRDGAIALSWSWDVLANESIRVASYVDTFGRRGDIVCPASIAKGIRKPDGIRAVRDMVWNEEQKEIIHRIKRNANAPRWLVEAANTMHLWRSIARVHELARRCRIEGIAEGPAYEALHKFVERDLHLYDYEKNARDEALRERREWYRLHACWIARTYRHALVSDHDLSREARWGDESDVRFTAAPDQLRGAIKNALGDDAIVAYWDHEPEWCERACAAYLVGGARGEMFAERKEKTSNAWAARKKKKTETMTARKEAANASE